MKQRRWARIGCAMALLWQAAPMAQPRVLEPGVEWLPGSIQSSMQPDGNSVLIEAPDGWIVVDSGRSPVHAQALLDRIRASGKPLRAIVNTHWHLDHIGGNRALRDAYPLARVMASDAIIAARTGFLADYRRQLLDELAKHPSQDAQRSAWQRDVAVVDDVGASAPDVVIGERATLELAGLGLSIGVERGAVTAGDVWVYESGSQVLAVGDLVTLPVPPFGAACPERWTAALERISTIRFRWLVPGHGEPLGRGQFVIYREAFERLLRCAASDAPKQQCIDGWLRDAGGLFPREQQPLARSRLSHDFDPNLRAARDASCRP